MTKLPRGATPLADDDAIRVLAAQDHPEADQGSSFFDFALASAIRSGQITACRLRDGRLGFTRTGR